MYVLDFPFPVKPSSPSHAVYLIEPYTLIEMELDEQRPPVPPKFPPPVPPKGKQKRASSESDGKLKNFEVKKVRCYNFLY